MPKTPGGCGSLKTQGPSVTCWTTSRASDEKARGGQDPRGRSKTARSGPLGPALSEMRTWVSRAAFIFSFLTRFE